MRLGKVERGNTPSHSHIHESINPTRNSVARTEMSELNCGVQYCTVDTSDGVKLNTMIFTPDEDQEQEPQSIKTDYTIVLVHPYSILGGCQGLLRGMATGLATRGYKAVTFDMRGVGKSTGRASLTGYREVRDVVAVCTWVSLNLSSNRILLVGSSAGTPFLF